MIFITGIYCTEILCGMVFFNVVFVCLFIFCVCFVCFVSNVCKCFCLFNVPHYKASVRVGVTHNVVIILRLRLFIFYCQIVL